MDKPLKVGVVGGLGLMASPMAGHLAEKDVFDVVRVHDRGRSGAARDKRRAAWKSSGALLVSELEELVGKDSLDGVFVCCGKNGDDAKLIGALTALLSTQNNAPFLCHLSTVSAGFADAAFKHAASKGIRYANYPLTGGPIGAEKAKMLILASGSRELYDQLLPGLRKLGNPRYFGPSPRQGAEVKLIGHLMVFGGLLGISSAVSVHSESFSEGKLGGEEQTGFFDFLNGGAGHTRQWDMIAHAGIAEERWEEPFQSKYAVVDALYAAALCVERKVSKIAVQNVMTAAFAFSYVVGEVGIELATHAIIREMVAKNAPKLDAFLDSHFDQRAEPREWIRACIETLPGSIKDVVALDVSDNSFSQ